MSNSENLPENISLKTRLMVVLWPAFLVACLATGVFFSLFDPLEMIVLDERLQLHALGAYTIGFLLFWLLAAMSSLLTSLLLQKVD